MKGKFIVFEGIDGCGKTTQASLLVEHLNSIGYKSWLTEEPTNLSTGRFLRRLLSDVSNIDLQGEELDLFIQRLFAADRYYHLNHAKQGIKQKLAEGYNVICSRYILSSFAYSGLTLKEEIMQLNTNFLLPDLTIFLDISPSEAKQRLSGRDKKDSYDSKINQAVTNYYHYLFQDDNFTTPYFESNYIGRNVTIECGKNPNSLATHILEELEINFSVCLKRPIDPSYDLLLEDALVPSAF